MQWSEAVFDPISGHGLSFYERVKRVGQNSGTNICSIRKFITLLFFYDEKWLNLFRGFVDQWNVLSSDIACSDSNPKGKKDNNS